MSARNQNTALLLAAAVAVSLLGCTESIEAPASPVTPDAVAPLASDGDPIGVSAWGLVRQEEGGAPLQGVAVCDFYDHSACDRTDEDGMFELDGLLAGAMGLLELRIRGRAPVLVPVALDQEVTFIELAMPRDDMHQRLLKVADVPAPAGDGAVRFQMWRSQGYGLHPLRVSWTSTEGDATTISTTELPNTARQTLETWAVGLSAGIRSFRWSAAEGSLLCSRRSGWRGAGYGEVVVPVLAGYVTHVEQVCVVVMP